MKYNPFPITLLVVCCVLCVTSCSSDSAYEPEIGNGAEMSFDVAAESRSIPTVITEFSVYGDKKFQAGDMGSNLVFNKTAVVNRDGVWCYEGTQYWYPNYEHSFVAVSPSSALESEALPQYVNSKLSFAFAMPTYSGREMQDAQDKNDLIDVLAATHRRLYNAGDKLNAISLRFGHLLSMINFAPKFDDKTLKTDNFIRFHRVEISGLKKKVEIAVAPAPLMENLQTDDRLIEFTGHDGNDKLTITFTEPKIINNGQQRNLFADDDALIMLPQLFDASSEATVRFTYSFKDDPEILRHGSISLIGQEWKTGTAYTYNFTVDKIGLNVGTTSIKAWDTLNISDINWNVE